MNLANASNITIGSTSVSAVYLGNTLIWPSTPTHDYSTDYLTFEALQNTTFKFTRNDLQYSIDNGSTWTTLGANTASPTVTTGTKIMWKQTGLTPREYYGIGTFSATGNFKAYGNIMSLYYGDNFVGEDDLTGKNDAFFDLFYGNTKIIDTSNLILPATTLADSCYAQMFFECTSLTTAPSLPATTLTAQCYTAMFRGCTSLTTAPSLSATTLAHYCCSDMFYGCTSLTTAPSLSATTLANECYDHMFYGCTSLTTAPELPVTTLAEKCYSNMFEGCTSLTTAPHELPATILTLLCYGYMFRGCTSLTTAPILPATTLTTWCYESMFEGCTNLNYIKCLATNIYGNYTYDWVSNVAASGTFVKDANTSWTTGTSGIPTGWTVQNA